jgi:hypothetical protein
LLVFDISICSALGAGNDCSSCAHRIRAGMQKMHFNKTRLSLTYFNEQSERGSFFSLLAFCFPLSFFLFLFLMVFGVCVCVYWLSASRFPSACFYF